jgi:cell division protein FtsL
MRLLHFLVIAALVAAASYVYHIKFDSTQRAERVAKLRSEIRRERESIASLRAEWAKLENPARLQGLAVRHLTLKPIEPAQFDALNRLPERPPSLVPPDAADPIGALIDISESDFTSSIPLGNAR